MKRCAWAGSDPLNIAYHDEEWGVPVMDAPRLYEMLVLEGMQAGLSWLTVLRKRARMREQFFAFDMEALATQGDAAIAGWLEDPGIIRHRGKLEAMVGNARCALAQDDFAGLLWDFAPARSPVRRARGDVPAQTPESQAMSRTLKKAGFRFVGPTICYAFMQSVGMVNDHVGACFRRAPCAEAQRQLAR